MKNIYCRQKNGFTLMEVVIAVSLLAIVSVVSLSVVTNLLRSAVKSQANVDIEQTSNFVLLKLNNDLSKAYFVEVMGGGKTLKINQSAGTAPIYYYLLNGAVSGNCASTKVLGCIRRGATTTPADATPLTDATDNTSAVSVDYANSQFSAVPPLPASPLAVNIVIKFAKPTVSGPAGGSFSGESTLNTTIALPAI